MDSGTCSDKLRVTGYEYGGESQRLRLPAYSLGVHISFRPFVLAGVLLSAAPVHAQVSVGLVGGATFFEINASGDESANVRLTDKLGPLFGVVVAIDINESFQVAPEAAIAIKGARLGDDVQIDGIPRPWDFNLTYLDVPVLARFRPGGKWLHLVGGPYVAWLLRTKVEARDGGFEPEFDGAFETFDFGWVFGLGVGSDRARVDFRYSGGLTDLDANGTFAVLFTRDQGVSFRNRGFSLVGAILF